MFLHSKNNGNIYYILPKYNKYMISTIIQFIRKKINPLPLKSPSSSSSLQDKYEETVRIENPGIDDPQEELEELKEDKSIYVGIENTDLPQRVQHNICNLIGLDKEELDYIARLNCKHMFEIIKLLNKAVITLVDGI
jgi:hypothetical protein